MLYVKCLCKCLLEYPSFSLVMLLQSIKQDWLFPFEDAFDP